MIRANRRSSPVCKSRLLPGKSPSTWVHTCVLPEANKSSLGSCMRPKVEEGAGFLGELETREGGAKM